MKKNKKGKQRYSENIKVEWGLRGSIKIYTTIES